jgi:hypothetical protein
LVGVEDACRAIPEELGLDGGAHDASSGATLGDRVSEVVGDGAVDPSPNNVIHANPVGRVVDVI